MNYYDKHIGDFLKDTITLSMMEEGAYNRLLDQYYQSEKPLPLQIKEIYKLARADGSKEKHAVDAVLIKFFTKTDAGFVQKRAQEVIEKYWDSESDNEVKKENQNERQRRSRDRRKALFDALREAGITPQFNTKTAELSRILSRVTGSNNHGSVTGDDTATQKPVTSNHSPVTNVNPNTASETLQVLGARASAVEISIVMRKNGINSQPADPRLIALSEQGTTVETVASACQEAKIAKPNESVGVGYIVAILNRWAADAANIKVQGAQRPSHTNTKDSSRAAAAASIGLGARHDTALIIDADE